MSGIGPPQFCTERASLGTPGVYERPDFGERDEMQNQQHSQTAKPMAGLQWRSAGAASPKVVLMVVGVVGLLLDLFVRPISPIGLALILLATAPWILQAWSQRKATGTSAGAALENANRVPARGPGPVQGTGRMAPRIQDGQERQRSFDAPDHPRKGALAEPAAGQRSPPRPA